MKFSPLFLLTFFFVNACTFEYSEGGTTETKIGTTEDFEDPFANEVKITENGIQCESVFMSNEDGKFERNCTFGEVIQMNFEDVSGIEIEDGLIRIDIMFLFTTLNGDTLSFFDYGDIKEQDVEVDKEKLDLNIYTAVHAPMWSNNKYLFKGGIKDVRTGNTVEGEVELNVNPNYDIEVKGEGFEYTEVYLYDRKSDRIIVNQEINKYGENQIRIIGIEGFNLKNDNALIGASLRITADNGEEYLYLEDMGANMPNGMPFADIAEMLTIDYTLTEDANADYIDIEVNIWDKNGDATLDISSRVDVRQ